MYALYSFLLTFVSSVVGLFFLKSFQLEGYKLKNYIKKIVKFQFVSFDKNRLNYTKRIKRLIFFDFFLNFWLFFLIFYFLNNAFVILIVVIFIFIRPIEIVLSFLIAMPFEEFIKKQFIKKAKNKLAKMKCKKIAITGSFGKTTTKNILYQILSEEFDVCATPKSFNTPMGVCKTILENLKETDDIFVVELGARHKGDIKFLADFVGVDFGIITPIGKCHLETFGTIENIESTKFELCESAKQFVVFNGKNKSTKSLFERFERKKFLVCDNGSFAYAKNITTNSEGSEFDMVLDKKVFHCKTKLLGQANIDNIVVASTMAYLLGENVYNILRGIKNVQQVAHRLEIIKSDVATVIDDSYNSNFDGFCQALEVLKGFEGRKIVVSPGVVELGKEQYETNLKIGKKIFEYADIFVIMNKTNKEALFEGAKEFGREIYFANTRQEQKEILKKVVKAGDVVLFENDLPDNYR